jgi:hypothetical protein
MCTVVPEETGLHGPVHLLVTAHLTHVLAEGVCAECDQAQPFYCLLCENTELVRPREPTHCLFAVSIDTSRGLSPPIGGTLTAPRCDHRFINQWVVALIYS